MTVYAGKGTTVWVTHPSTLPSGETQIGKVVTVRPNDASVGTYDTSDLSHSMREHTNTIGDGGSLIFSIIYDPVTIPHAMLTNAPSTPAFSGFSVATTGSTGDYGFVGIITGVSRQPATVDGLHMLDLTVKMTGVFNTSDP